MNKNNTISSINSTTYAMIRSATIGDIVGVVDRSTRRSTMDNTWYNQKNFPNRRELLSSTYGAISSTLEDIYNEKI